MAFEKFTDKARHVLVLAQEEARSLSQPHVGSEHLLLGLAKDPGYTLYNRAIVVDP